MTGSRVLLAASAGLLLLALIAVLGDGAAPEVRLAGLLLLSAAIGAVIAAVVSRPLDAGDRRSTAERSDAELVTAASLADDEAWAELEARYKVTIVALLEHMLGRRDRAEDVAGQLFVGARGRLPEKPPDVGFKRWIHELALGAVADAGGRPAPRAAPDEPVETPSETEQLRSKLHYVSADTTPAQFAVARRMIVAPALLIVYAAICAALVPALPTLMEWYGQILSSVSGVEAWKLLGKGGSLSFRPFLLALIVLLCAFAPGPPVERLKVLGFATAVYLAAISATDVVLALGEHLLVPPFSQVGGIVTGLIGLLAIITTIFLRYRLPAGIKVVRRRPGSRRFLVILGLSAMLVATLVAALSLARTRYFDDWHLRFIGGLDSELVLFLLGMVSVLALWSALDRSSKPHEGPWLSAAFLIPAFNEAHGIAETIRSLDVAAARYNARCDVYIVDNGSWDDTVGVARRALDECPNLRGHVLQCPEPGKSHALNFGLRHIEEEVIVRIDGDTLVEPSLLENLIPWFWDPSVGAVGGLPLPKRTAARWLFPLRMIEVYYGVTFLRVAQGAADAVLVVPGLIAAYRRQAVEELGGFGAGFNGEDADITMRIGRLGYRVVTDPDVRVYTEVPESLAQLREQRQRWSRGLYHMAGRNMSSIWMRQGPRALWNLPWSIFNASRRAMMIPVLVAALTVEILEPSVFSLREVSVVAGFLIGLQLIVISLLLVAHRKFAVLPYVPSYLVFRMLRAYIAFETVLTLRLKVRSEHDDGAAGARDLPAFEGAELRPQLREFARELLTPIPELAPRRRAEAYLERLLLEARPGNRIESPWPWEPVRALLVARLTERLPPRYWTLESSPIDGAQAGAVAADVVMAATAAGSCPINWRLWATPARRNGASASSAGPAEAAVDMLAELRSWGIAPPVICAGRRFGDLPEFRTALEALGLRYVLEVSAATPATPAIPLSESTASSNGSAPREAPLSGIALATGPRRAQVLSWDGEEGRRTSRFLVLGVTPAGTGSGGVAWSGTPVNTAICEWPPDAKAPIRYWLSNPPAASDVGRLVAIAKHRAHAAGERAVLERALAIDVGEAWSVDDWNSHVTLLSLAWGFRLELAARPPRRRPAAARPVRRVLASKSLLERRPLRIAYPQRKTHSEGALPLTGSARRATKSARSSPMKEL